MLAPASIYAAGTLAIGRPELLPGWAVPCATDIAFSYLVARVIFPANHPAIPFLLLLAIADDALGLVLLALFYPSGPLSLLNFAAFMTPALGISWWLKRRRTISFWPYVILGGGLSWSALYFGGAHPSLALVPILPFMPHGNRDLGLFDQREDRLPFTMNRFEHVFKVPVQFVLFFFGLANAGVPFGSVGGGTWLVLIGLIAGKPIGILLLTFIGVRLGLRIPGGLSYGQLLVVGITAGIGFTVALFFTTAAFAPGAAQDQAKMGALLSFVAAPIAILVGRILRIGAAGQSPQHGEPVL